jgi:hypothetical protein
MRIRTNLAGLRDTRWYEYAIRFLFGGIITIATGVIAKKFGPEIGGLFLAFPAIFPASATLVESHERKKKEKVRLHGERRGRNAAGLDAAGAALGSIGLIGFALVTWQFIASYNTAAVLAAATFAWFGIAFIAWQIREHV